MSSDVFISHSGASNAAARQLASALRAQGMSPWLDDEMLTGGQDVFGVVRSALEAARAVIILIEPEDEPDSWLRDQWSVALELAWAKPEKRLIPLLIAGAEVPPFLSNRVALRVDGKPNDWERAAREVAAALRNEVTAVGAIEPAAREGARRDYQRRLNDIEVAADTLWPRE